MRGHGRIQEPPRARLAPSAHGQRTLEQHRSTLAPTVCQGSGPTLRGRAYPASVKIVLQVHIQPRAELVLLMLA